MNSHYNIILKDTDKRIAEFCKEQIMDTDSRFHGGFYNQDRIVMVKYSVYKIMTMLSGFLNEDSKYYEDITIKERVDNGLDFVQRKQHKSGLFDLEKCNFESAPDTAFIMKRIFPVYEYLLESNKNEGIRIPLESILRKSAKGLMLGGFHTPNHRWAIASILALCGKLWNEPNYIQEANKYLAEGIDCNCDGEYSERSTGNYNRINNDCMLTFARVYDEKEYEAYAIKNLEMMLSYIEPDGSIFTENSTRFDKDLTVFPKYYYWQYLYLGYKYDRDDFLVMANSIMDTVEKERLIAPDILINFMNYPEMTSFNDYKSISLVRPSRFFSESGVVRYNNDDYSITIIKDNPGYLHVNYGGMKLTVKLLGSFFEHREFIGSSLEKISQWEFVLKQVMTGWYYLPFETKPKTSDWWQMENDKRPIRKGPSLKLEAKVAFTDSGVVLTLSTSGVEDAPFSVEFSISGEDEVLEDSEALRIYNKGNLITIGPRFNEHNLTGDKNHLDSSTKFYFTAYTPFDKKLEVRFGLRCE